ncbi:MAG: acetyl-CoA C-acetyltransferase [Chloroflexi bacterium]|nr:acetyl-CoA C-acetyltransferase [Chloroflexota bacterium]
MEEVVIVSAVRTAIGNFGGALKDVPAARLGATVIHAAIERAGLRPTLVPEIHDLAPATFRGDGPTSLEKQYSNWDPSLKETWIDEVIMGNVLQAGQGQNPARQAMIYAGVPKETTAFTINKVCASGMKAVALAAQSIKAGDAGAVVAGGMENMSSVPYYFPKARWGARMFNAEMVDGMVSDGLWETFYNYHMGITSENIAVKYGISREEQDNLSVVSNQRACNAIKNGLFKAEIVPVDVPARKGFQRFDTDEHPREDTSMATLGGLAPVFKNDGSVTAGNASAITDAAAALVVMSRTKAQQLGLNPLATIRAYAAGGIDPAFMGMGVVPATRRALGIAGLTLKDIDIFEINEAFASQCLGVNRELKLDWDRVNVNGGGISLGHPIGCTGARLLVSLAYEMRRRDVKRGLASLCIGGGQGFAMILER